ncbi:MAG: DUF1501 domain-containing protein [Verrucomicrobiota bacterium JB023]|nr:DUF1501 domain-containing protein [Verrucomicrobiota bacterium JB023]
MSDQLNSPNLLTRRKFLGQTACSAMTTASLLNSLLTMRSVNAQSAGVAKEADDYKALVCIFLFGGNDSANMLVPSEAGAHAKYLESRAELGLARSELLPLGASNDPGLDLAVHGAMTGCERMFKEKNLAFLANVGTLLGPATLSDYRNGTAVIPDHLFSHSDQQVAWQTSALSDNLYYQQTGWGGRIADALMASQEEAKISMLVSLSGTNFFQVGKTLLPFRMGADGAPTYHLGKGESDREMTRYETFRSLLSAENANMMEEAFSDLSERSIRDADTINAAIENTGDFETIPGSNLGNQLRMVAKLVEARKELGMKRQVFFVATGGFDTHGEQLYTHSGLLSGVSSALTGFHDALDSIGASDMVTSFTASDFGRTYDSNGRGSDHGWGGHHLISGGAVDGGKIYGEFPDPDITTGSHLLDTGRGRWLPTTSVDQYGATMARWFGLSDSQIHDVFPNLKNFSNQDLQFMLA